MLRKFGGRLCWFHVIAYALILAGAINWGLIAIGGYTGMNLNIVDLLFGRWPMLEQGIYLIIGFSALLMLFQRSCDYCSEEI